MAPKCFGAPAPPVLIEPAVLELSWQYLEAIRGFGLARACEWLCVSCRRCGRNNDVRAQFPHSQTQAVIGEASSAALTSGHKGALCIT
jgi:hypothetical protein